MPLALGLSAPGTNIRFDPFWVACGPLGLTAPGTLSVSLKDNHINIHSDVFWIEDEQMANKIMSMLSGSLVLK